MIIKMPIEIFAFWYGVVVMLLSFKGLITVVVYIGYMIMVTENPFKFPTGMMWFLLPYMISEFYAFISCSNALDMLTIDGVEPF